MASAPEAAPTGTGKAAPVESNYAAGKNISPRVSGVDALLRLLLFATSVSALVVLVTSKQTVTIPVLIQPKIFVVVTRNGKFSHSPALIYLLVALAVTVLYSIITLFISVSSLKKTLSTKTLFSLVVLDTLMTGIMASATGSAGSVSYIGLKGNSHVQWNKVCNMFDKFCRHVGSSTFLSLVISIILVLLVFISAFSLYRRSHN